MSSFDRLTTLMARFSLHVKPSPPETATLLVTAAPDGAPLHVWFGTGGIGSRFGAENIVFSAEVDWGGASNPLLASLPDQIGFDLSTDGEAANLVNLMRSELAAGRCGAVSVINRLGEVLIVRLLRAQIEAGSTEPGLLAGLSDPRLSRAIVAIHDGPGRPWRNEDLAGVAGLSLSRFSETFLAVVGETPAAYLRRWRLILARQDLVKGDRVDAVARRYGYDSAEGFTRAFKRSYGLSPVSLRHRPSGSALPSAVPAA
ncbi:MAG: AraC family transcriptional regulator [Hoeflea sp.]|uniref:helix-turn-helix transcriptional regulator n=1 Tax=Hoeflea sp. TaxID=1940281 RepID=UPI003EF5EAF0